ncbi:ABC transporter permease [Alkalihalobacillus trypoxylicola]|uniref:ABC transporter n=1 Tax=Alkalihalobacillus trypoxylicola TaxID=519424 RepID=A0A161QIS6_9BACI|nr:ABC transporter permease [Alkalihalobacillus trypoxylicola]KYG29428.1 ABC transporter [Alkalihalobacillus trypoxylicola]
MISLKRIQTIFVKDYKDLMKNSYMLTTVIIPIFFAYMFSRGEIEDAALLALPITLSLVVVGSLIQAGMIAEEKEKNTLRGLLLSPLNTSEIFIGKSLVSVIVSILVVMICIFVSGFKIPEQWWFFVLGTGINLIFFISIGTILGLLSRTVMETSVLGSPVMLLLGTSSFFTQLFPIGNLNRILDFLPEPRFALLITALNEGTSVIEHLLILGLWAFVSIILCVIIFKRRRFD